jgi:hypothetical protein
MIITFELFGWSFHFIDHSFVNMKVPNDNAIELLMVLVIPHHMYHQLRLLSLSHGHDSDPP